MRFDLLSTLSGVTTALYLLEELFDDDVGWRARTRMLRAVIWGLTRCCSKDQRAAVETSDTNMQNTPHAVQEPATDSFASHGKNYFRRIHGMLTKKFLQKYNIFSRIVPTFTTVSTKPFARTSPCASGLIFLLSQILSETGVCMPWHLQG